MATMDFSALSLEVVQEHMDNELPIDILKNKQLKEQKRLDERQRTFCLHTYDAPINEDRKTLRLLLLGKTGTGKSSTGNLIVGKKCFDESTRSTSQTSTIKMGRTVVDGTHILVIDTPGFCDTRARKDFDPLFELAKVVEICKEGFDGLLFVYNVANPRFTTEEKEAFKTLWEGPLNEIIQNSFVVITHGGNLAKVPTSLEEYIEGEADSSFGTLLKDMQGRVIAVENDDQTEYGRTIQREQLLRLVAAKTSEPCSPPAFTAFRDNAREVADAQSEELRGYIPSAQKAVSESMLEKTQKEVSEIDSELLAKHIVEAMAASKKDFTVKKKNDLTKVVAKIIGSTVGRLLTGGFIDQVVGFAVPLLKAAVGVAFKVVAKVRTPKPK